MTLALVVGPPNNFNPATALFELDIRVKGVSQVRAHFSKRLYLTYFRILEGVSLKQLPEFTYFYRNNFCGGEPTIKKHSLFT